MDLIKEPEKEFESLVNTEGIQTVRAKKEKCVQFESLVNTEGIQTEFLLN